MAGGAYVTRFKKASYDFYRWRHESSLLVKLALAFVFAALTGLGALMKFYIPWTPVPITGQVFFVLAAGVVLGRHFGGLSQVLYALLGLLLIPWFAGSNANPVPLIQGFPGLYQGVGGLAILSGATFGYIIGFIAAAFLVGWAVDTRVRLRTYPKLTLVLLSALAVIYVSGVIWFYVWWMTWSGLVDVQGPLGFAQLMLFTVIPFIPLDLVKVGLVAVVGGFVLPRRAYANEVDAPAAA